MSRKNKSKNSNSTTNQPTEEIMSEGTQDNSQDPVVTNTSNQPEVTTDQNNTQEPVVVVTQNNETTDFQTYIENIKQNGTVHAKSLIVSIENYMREMAPGIPMDNDKGARFQHTLWKTIYQVVENVPVDEFRKCWNIILSYFNNYKERKSVFNERYVFRFSEYWVWPEDELSAFQRTLNILILTANPETRNQELRHVDLDRSLELGYSDEGRQRIINFYRS